MTTATLPPMPADFEPTRATLHAYANAVGAIPRVHAIPHAKWWHISLEVSPVGLVTEPMGMPSGATFQLRMDLNAHDIVLETSRGDEQRFSMTAGTTATEMGDALISAVAALGLSGDYNRDKYENDEPRAYSADAASQFFAVLTAVHHVLAQHRATIEDRAGPLQVWPHGFDLAFEWFGTRVETYEEHGEVTEHPAQLNFGFYPGGDPYLYANPWPFDGEVLLPHALPSGAAWHTDGWEGSMLKYTDVAGKPHAADMVLAFTKTVFDKAAPMLQA